MRLKTAINLLHLTVTIVLLIVVISFIFLNHGSNDRTGDKLISQQQLNDTTWLYVTENGSGGATVPFIYRYYLTGKMDGELPAKLSKIAPFMEAGGSGANVSVGDDTINIRYGGRVFTFSNSVAFESNGNMVTPHIHFEATN